MMTLCKALQEKFSGENAFDKVFATEGKVYRNFKGRKTLRFEHDGNGYFLKIHPGVGWGEIIKSLLSLKAPVLGAKDERDAILALERIGVQTMSIAGYGTRGSSPATMQSFIITEEITDSLSLEELVLEGKYKSLPAPMKRLLIKQVAEIARTMHKNGVNHRDFYICHFLLPKSWLDINRSDVEPPLYVIDLHRTQVRSTVPQRWLEKDLAGLHFSAMDAGLTTRDRLRFISYYENRSLSAFIEKPQRFWSMIDKKAIKLYRKFQRHYG